MEDLRAELDADLQLVSSAARDVLDLARRRALAPVGWNPEAFHTGGILYLLDLARRTRTERVPDLVVLLAFAKGGLALSREYASALRSDAGGLLAHDLVLLRAVVGLNRAVLRLERPVSGYVQLVEILDEITPEAGVLDALATLARNHAVAAAERRGPPPEEIDAARRDVVLVLAHFQLLLATTLKWDLVARAKAKEAGEDVAEARAKYTSRIRDAIRPLAGFLRRK